MRNPWSRRVIGIVAFALPALMTMLGMGLDRSGFRHDPTYAQLISPVMWTSLFVAAVVPAALIMSSAMSLPKRIALTAVIWCLLAIQCGLAFYIALMSGLR